MSVKLQSRDGWLVSFIVIGLATVVGLSHWIDSHKPPVNTAIEEEQLYLNGATARRLSLGFNGLAADWYWMRALQYVGRKIIDAPADLQIDTLGKLNLKLLAPLLDTATTLDPQFMEPYQYAAVILPDVDREQAIRITKKGIAANPDAWRLYQQLGYIYWQQKDFQAAGDAYEQGAKVPGAPPWMLAMKARMAAEGGSSDVAREIYQRMYEQAGDEHIKDMARRRLLQVDAIEQMDRLRKVLEIYKSKFGSCPAKWSDITPVLHFYKFQVNAEGSPVDPAGTAYVLTSNCDVDTDVKSLVPHR